jgi:dTDP-4-dehydrorhamnose reductase
MKKILLTGANGQIGREIQHLFPIQQERLVALSKAELNIADHEQITQVIKAYQPAIIINAAAYTAVDKAESETELAFAVNSTGVKNLATAANKFHIPIIHLSTDYVFDGLKNTAYVEKDERSPLNVYGSSKAQGEQYLQDILAQHIILRVSWVFGKYGHNFVKTILKLAREKPELNIVADQIGCPTPAADIADVIHHLVEFIEQGKAKWGVFHYCGDQALSWYDFAKQIMSYAETLPGFICQRLNPITTAQYPTPAARPKNSVLSTKKIQQEYDILPANIKNGLRAIIDNL